MRDEFTEKQMMEEAFRNIDNISQGNIISGKIVKVTEEHVFVDIGYKSEGRINYSEFDKIKLIPHEGLEIQSKIMRLDDSKGNIVLSYLGALEKQAWEKLLDANVNKKPVTVIIEKEIKGGYSVNFEKVINMFMPKSQLTGVEGDIEGKQIDVAVLEIDRNKKNIVVSKRALEDDKKRQVWDRLFEHKQKGDLIKGSVSRIVDFGAFIDFGGLEGLLHSSDISWGRVDKIDDFVKVGDELEVIILDMKKNKFQISLGLKQKSPEPWKIIQDKFNTGDDVTGKVVSLTKYGAFVALMPGLEGLLHISDMSWKKLDNPDELVKPGDEIKVRILDIDKENKRISLGVKQLTSDPWEKIDEIAQLGKEVEGKIIKIINSGAILEIVNGVEGYIHVSDMSWSRKNSHPQEFVTDGQIIKAKVIEVDKNERKLRLGIKQLTEDPWESAGQKFNQGQKVKGKITGITKFGAFVEIAEGIEGLLHITDLSWSGKISDPSEVVKEGETIDVIITSIDVENKKLSLGLKQLSDDPWQKVKEKYPENSIVEGTVTNIRPFGVFVELAEGVEGLLHVSDFSWTEKTRNPAELVKKGEKIKVRVLNYDSGKRQIALGLKQVEEDPYDKYTEGLTVAGKVVDVMKFGARVALEEGVSGFIHISELSEEHVENVEDFIKAGDEVEVKILENNKKDRKIKLSVKDAQFGKIANEYLMDEETGVSVGDILRKAMKKK